MSEGTRSGMQATPWQPPPIFGSLAYLYSPADPACAAQIIELRADWTQTEVPSLDVDVVLWGRMPARGRPHARLVADAARRELALTHLRARPPKGLRVSATHRLPPVHRPGHAQRAIRSVLMGGLLVELVRGERTSRVIDDVATAAGATAPARLRPSGDGSALARLTLAEGTAVELRVAKDGHTKDPRRGRAALLALAAAEIPLVPRPVAEGLTAGARWTTETVAAGSHARRLTPALLDDITALSARLPDGPEDADAIVDQLAVVAAAFAGHGAALAAIGAAAREWTGPVRRVLLHGDLWLNNLLVEGGRLSGLIDWDTWHPGGLPGADLLGLVMAEERTRSRRDFGQLLIEDHWRSPDVLGILEPYFRERGIPFPDRAGLVAVAIAWWASRITGSLERSIAPGNDPAWVRRNVDAPIERLLALVEEHR
jgi:hypothetical protein